MPTTRAFANMPLYGREPRLFGCLLPLRLTVVDCLRRVKAPRLMNSNAPSLQTTGDFAFETADQLVVADK